MKICRKFCMQFVVSVFCVTLAMNLLACATGESQRCVESQPEEAVPDRDARSSATELERFDVNFPGGEPEDDALRELGELEYVGERVEVDQHPAEVRQWVQRVKQVRGGHTLTHGDNRYILISAGLQSTPGTDVEITEFEVLSRLGVIAEIEEPTEEQKQQHLLEYPYDLVILNDEIDPSVEVGISTASLSMFQYDGEVPEISGGSESMVLFEPTPEQHVDETVRIQGAGHGYEGGIQYEFWSGYEKIEEGGIGGASPRRHVWSAFDAEIEIPEVDEERFSDLFGGEIRVDGETTGHPQLELRMYPTDAIRAAGGGVPRAPEPHVVIELDHRPDTD